MEKVYLYFETEYTEERMDALVSALLAPYGGASTLAAGRKSVLIKPNLVSKKPPESGVTTHPLMLRSLCKAFLDAGLKVTVAESHGGVYTEASAKAQLAGCGVLGALKDLDVQLYTKAESALHSAENGVLCKSFEMVKAIAEADFIVNLCKVKTHSLTVYTGALKNTFGAVPGMRKFELHARFPEKEDFAKMLLDLHLSLPVVLNIADGIAGMEGNGPTAGVTRAFGFVAACESAALCDLVCTDLLGLRCADVPLLAEAARRGLCPEEASFEMTNLTAEEYEKARVRGLKLPDSSPKGAVSLLGRLQRLGGGRIMKLFRSKPKVNKAECAGCGKCAEYCPAKTIEMKNGKPHINRSACIRCFCCQELCPVGAMKIKTNRIVRL